MFDEVKSIITSCVDGYNVCTLAYGQTGSGKTFTVMGPKHDPGVNVRYVVNEVIIFSNFSSGYLSERYLTIINIM